MMDNSHYVSINAGSTNWSPIYALSFMIYEEALIAGRNHGETDVLNMQLLRDRDLRDLPQEAQDAIAALQLFFQNHSQNGQVQHIDASALKAGLSPYLFKLYASLALMPQDTEENRNATRAALTNFLGAEAKAEAFMATARLRHDEIQTLVASTPVDAAHNNQPQESLEPHTASHFKSPELTAHLFSIFCNDGHLPHIFKDNSVFGCFEHNTTYQKRYALRESANRTFTLLANKSDGAVNETFDGAFFNREDIEENAARYNTQAAPRGLNYYFGSMATAGRTLLGFAAVISAIVSALFLIKQLTKPKAQHKVQETHAHETLDQKTNSAAPINPKKVRFSEPLILSAQSPARAKSTKTSVHTVRTSDKRWGRKRR